MHIELESQTFLSFFFFFFIKLSMGASDLKGVVCKSSLRFPLEKVALPGKL